MADFAGLPVVGIILGVVALVAVIVAIVVWAVRCAVARRRAAEAKETSTGLGAGLLDREAAVVAVVVAEPKREEALCAICKGPLAGGEKLRRLRACGHVYHAECVDPWLKRKPICPLCRAKVEVSRTDIVHAMV